jgi:hypothetical protein
MGGQDDGDKLKRAVCNFASGKWYPRGQERLRHSLIKVGFKGDVLRCQDPKKIGSPTHAQVPYAFKTHSLMNAMNRGYDQAIYADSSIWAVKPWTPVWDIITKQGYYFEEAGQWTGVWTKDSVLRKFGITRDQAMTIPMFTAGFTGLDFRNKRAVEFLREWHRFACDGESFKGTWGNENGQMSQDKRCKGHRHDMSVASLLAWKMGMKLGKGATFLCYIGPAYRPPKDTVVAYLQPC